MYQTCDCAFMSENVLHCRLLCFIVILFYIILFCFILFYSVLMFIFYVVSSTNVLTFGSRLDKVWSNQVVRFCYKEEIRL